MPLLCANDLTSMVRGCKNNTGGISRHLINAKDAYTYDIDTVTNLELNFALVNPTNTFIELDVSKEGLEAMQKLTANFENGSNVGTTDVKCRVHGLSSGKSKIIEDLMTGQQLLGLVIADTTGKEWHFPNLQLKEVEAGWGKKLADGQGYNLTLVADISSLARQIPAGTCVILGSSFSIM